MKRIIDGRRFDTATAEVLADWNNGLKDRDSHLEKERLYKTKAGQFFLEFDGGPLSQYSVKSGGYSQGKQGLRLLTKTEAMTWLEKKEKTVALEKHFGEKITEG